LRCFVLFFFGKFSFGFFLVSFLLRFLFYFSKLQSFSRRFSISAFYGDEFVVVALVVVVVVPPPSD